MSCWVFILKAKLLIIQDTGSCYSLSENIVVGEQVSPWYANTGGQWYRFVVVTLQWVLFFKDWDYVC